MPSTASRITIDVPRQHSGMVHWEGELSTPSGESHRIYFEFSIPDDQPYLPHSRPFLLAFLVPAMHAGVPLELELPVDAVTLNNLMEWQEAMASWFPQKLKVVPIHAPLDAPSQYQNRPGALTAFSGGVDSNFTAHRHSRVSNSPMPPMFRTAQLQAGLMIHGFDIPLDQPPVFESAFAHSRAMLEAYGLKAYRMTTNLRSLEKVPGCDWEKSTHGSWLAATLSCYEPWFGQILIPSTYPYPVLRYPWASNPATDPLFSSATTACWHDGTANTKLTKVQAIAGVPAVQEHLRVCWEGEQHDRNCGKCFKCIATQICFQLSGVDHPAAFPVPCTVEEVAVLPVKTPQNEWLLRSICNEAQHQGKLPIARALTHALARAKIKPPFRGIKKWALRFTSK
jgi:hypothetical protein